MAETAVGSSVLWVSVLLSWLLFHCDALEEVDTSNTFTVSSFRYPKSEVAPYDLRYIRVDLPLWFSSVSVSMESDVNLDVTTAEKLPKSLLPVICFRSGGPPLPDGFNTGLKGLALESFSNGSSTAMKDFEIAEQCYTMQKNIVLSLTNEQITPGVWYLGLFNGVGATRTQGKMIVRSQAYSFSANVTVEGCTTSMMWGPFCNQTVHALSCSRSINQSVNTISCTNPARSSCQAAGEAKIYSLDIAGISEQLTVTATNIRFNTLDNGGNKESALMCYVRYGTLPSVTVHDYSGDLRKGELVIKKPKIGGWYALIVPSNLSNTTSRVCHTVNSEVLECPPGKAGPNCTWQSYILQTLIRKGSTPFESYYLPIGRTIPSGFSGFPIEPISSNSSYSGETDSAIWTYFLLNVPRGAAGGNIHIRLTSETEIDHEVYVRCGGLPSLESWDYYYANRTNSSGDSTFFKLYGSSKGKIDFYILYAREGTWGVGLRQINSTASSKNPTVISASLERCPRRCSSHGNCKFAFDASGLTSFSFCSCDRTHGGFDCSIEIVSHQGHLWQSIALIASNAAALLPAYWALRQREYAEWVLFTSSGISSGLYHACDVGTWCALSYNVLQFMDFWLSFMAVVSTFVYLSTADEAFKRTIHTAVAILTALMALTKATRSANIVIVLAIGFLGLFVGLLVEFAAKYRLHCSAGFSLNLFERQWTFRDWLNNVMKRLKKRFHWGFVLAGSVAFTMAALCWKFETSVNYWIWHSIWHVTIYTSSFFFLCSKVTLVNSESDARPGDNYQLARQDSLPRTT